jgi:hypothetical protein
MEENISSLSEKSTFPEPVIPVKNKRNYLRIFTIAVTAVLVLLVSLNLVDRRLWKNYYEKYYVSFINKHDFDEQNLDDETLCGYIPYSADGKKYNIEFRKPLENTYDFAVNIDSVKTYPELYWTVQGDDTRYSYSVECQVKRFGKKCYLVGLYPYEAGSTINYRVIGCMIDDDGNFVKDNEAPELTADDRRILEYFKDDILEIKNIIDSEM